MQLLYPLAFFLALGKVLASDTGGENHNVSVKAPMEPQPRTTGKNITLPNGTTNITLPDGTFITSQVNTCFAEPKAPPVPGNSTKFDHGTCSVCVAQSLEDGDLTLGSLHSYRIWIQDESGHDMGTVANVTLAAFGGETGGRQTSLTRRVAGKDFHFWTMRDPGFPYWAAVYMNWGGSGPADPFEQPPMIYSYAWEKDSLAQSQGMIMGKNCGNLLPVALSPDGWTVYFMCIFTC